MKSPIITLALLGLCSWLGWTTYELAGKPVPKTGDRVGVAGSAAKPLAPPVKTKGTGQSARQETGIVFPPLETLGDITARPLFNVSRRPIKEDKSAPEEKPADLNIMLSGIVIGNTGEIAHLRSATDPQTQALRVGDKIGAWQIQSIFPDRVVLKSGGRVETLYMQKPGARNNASGRSDAAGAKSTTRRNVDRAKRNAQRNSRRNIRRNRRGR